MSDLISRDLMDHIKKGLEGDIKLSREYQKAAIDSVLARASNVPFKFDENDPYKDLEVPPSRRPGRIYSPEG